MVIILVLMEWTINEMAQYTEYPEGGFYEWHVDNDVNMAHEPPVRKISMTLLLSPESEFEGGDLELMSEGKVAKIKTRTRSILCIIYKTQSKTCNPW